jgi:lysophospholipase L1-like esterase
MRIARSVWALLLLTACGGITAGDPPEKIEQTSQALTPPAGANYLALGDSIAFGFSPLLPYAPSFTQFVGYPESTAAAEGLDVANASCPGETSGSFLDPTAPDNGCHSSPFYFDQGLKVDYQGLPSQADYARAFLTSTPSVQLVTINLGGNDLLLVQNACGGTSNTNCIAEKLPGALATFATNLQRIFAGIRGTGYAGHVVALTQYATNYRDATQVAALTSLNAEITTAALTRAVAVADAYGAFLAASASTLGDPCAAGLLIRMPDGTCNIHPSTAGRAVLTNAVLSVAR